MAKIKIENIVASTSFNKELDLAKIAASVEGAEYKPKHFPGLVYKLKEPKTAMLLFRSGKIVCTGAKSLKDVKIAIEQITKNMGKAGVKVAKKPRIVVQNIVASSDLNAELNLNAIAISLGLEKVEYEPEQFPGAILKLKDPKSSLLLFKNGKVICTGTKSEKEVDRALKKTLALLKPLAEKK